MKALHATWTETPTYEDLRIACASLVATRDSLNLRIEAQRAEIARLHAEVKRLRSTSARPASDE